MSMPRVCYNLVTYVVLVAVALQSSACSFLFTHGPPAGHEQLDSFTCTESDAVPILDVIWGSLNALGAGMAAGSPDAYANPGEIVIVGLGWAVLSSFSASDGFSKSKKCRDAKRQLAERQAMRLAVPPLQQGNAAVQAVVVAPASDTLSVGERIQLTATAHSSSGAVVSERVFTWSSSNDAIASVGNAGLVTAHATGTVVIAANTSNVVGTARIVVSGYPDALTKTERIRWSAALVVALHR